MQPNNEIKQIVNELIVLGRDADELNYWLSIYDDLNENRRAELLSNLKKELEVLKS